MLLLSLVDRRIFKANHGFSLHVIEAPIPSLPDLNPSLAFPRDVFSHPFHYLGRGAQSFVFESQDQKTVLKFYRFPSHLRRFPWTHHPFGYLFSPTRKNIKEYNLRRLELSFHSFFLAATSLTQQTGVLYAHLQPTTDLHQKVHLIDNLGVQYELPLDTIAFIVQQRGVSFITHFKEQLAQNKLDICKKMLKGVIELIQNRCNLGITDLDNMDNDNYGWLEDQAIHLDIGRFQENESINAREEILRITHPLTQYLSEVAPELYTYFNQCVP